MFYVYKIISIIFSINLTSGKCSSFLARFYDLRPFLLFAARRTKKQMKGSSTAMCKSRAGSKTVKKMVENAIWVMVFE
jgi:hypothetical protein